jgi:hypothetical protein
LASLKFVCMVLKFWIFSQQEVKKTQKLAKSLKNFSRTVSATGEQKTVFKSLRGPFSSLF